MTAKEKAKELVDKYYSDIVFVNRIFYIEAKLCALIAVAEILNLDYLSVEERDYWKEVKKEIKLL